VARTGRAGTPLSVYRYRCIPAAQRRVSARQHNSCVAPGGAPGTARKQARRARAPVLPSMPNVAPAPPGSACLARSLVSTRMMLAPQFCASVRGMTSSAVPTARYGPCAAAR